MYIFRVHYYGCNTDKKGYGLMLFTKVIFSTCGFSKESLTIVISALRLFMSKKSIKKSDSHKKYYFDSNGYFNRKIIKRTFFTSPQLKITLFKPVFLQLALMHFTNVVISNIKRKLIKREINVSTY